MNSKVFIVAMCLGCFGHPDREAALQLLQKTRELLVEICDNHQDLGKEVLPVLVDIVRSFKSHIGEQDGSVRINTIKMYHSGIISLYNTVMQKDNEHGMKQQEVYDAVLTLTQRTRNVLSDTMSSAGLSEYAETYSSRSSVMPDTSETEPATVPHSVETSETEPVEKANVGVAKDKSTQCSEVDEEEGDLASLISDCQIDEEGTETTGSIASEEREEEEYTEEQVEEDYNKKIQNILKSSFATDQKQQMIDSLEDYLVRNKYLTSNVTEKFCINLRDDVRKTEKYQSFLQELKGMII